MVYNITNSTSLAEIGTNVVLASNYLFSGLTLLLFFIVIIIATKNFETRVGLLVSSALVTLMTVLFWWINWAPYYWVFYPAILTFAAILWNVLGE